jgi:hypothetical protein
LSGKKKNSKSFRRFSDTYIVAYDGIGKQFMSATKRRRRKAKFQALETIRHRESSKRCPNPLGDGQKMQQIAVMQKKMMLEKMKMCRRCYRR